MESIRCRDCDAELAGPYCHECGEEADPNLDVRGLLSELTEELTDFDSRLFKTLRALFLKPGLLTREFLDGHRRSYIRPLKLFLIIAAIQLIAVTNDTGGTGLLRLDFLRGFDPGIDAELAVKAKALATTPAEITAGVDANAQMVYRALQFVALAATALLAAVLFRSKGWSYVVHLLFAMHMYCFRYSAAILMAPLLKRIPASLALLYAVNAVYLYLGIRRVYEPTRGEGIAKAMVVYFGVFIQGGILMLVSLFGAYWWAMR